MGLRDKYQQGAPSSTPAASSASAAPSTPPATTPTSAEPSLASASSSPVAASDPPTTPISATARRDLGALRQRLAGGVNGGVNPPEASSAVADDMLEPNTRETPDGGAEPLPNHPDAAKAVASAAPAAAPAPTSSPSTDSATATKRKRRTKAEMEAARAAAAAGAATTAAAATASPSAGSAPTAPAEESPLDTPEGRRELAAAAAETAGFVILTDDLRAQLIQDIRQDLLQNLSLGAAIELVRERMLPGMKALEVER